MNRRKACLTLGVGVGVGVGVGLALSMTGARAQGGRSARIGIVEYGVAPDSALTRLYLEALAGLGWREGGTLGVERRHAGGRPERFGELLRELAALPVELVFAPGHDIAKAAKATIPAMAVVTVGSEDPVQSGLIQSLARPGGSITGVSFMSPELAAKRLELLKAMLPGLARVGVLWEPEHADTYYQSLDAVAATMGLRLHLASVRSAAELEPAFAELAGARSQALFVVPSRLTGVQARRIVELAGAARLPLISAYASFADAGGLMSYGAVTGDGPRRAAAQTDRILRGARAGELPFELPTRFELVVNLKVAAALGLTIPPALRLRADRVIE